MFGKILSSVANVFTGADSTRRAGEQAAAQMREASREGAAAAAFRPVGMTTRFGTSQFTREIDPETGIPYISSAGYTAAPELAALQNRLFGAFSPALSYAETAGQGLSPLAPASQRLFQLGEGYLAMTPEQAAQDYVRSQQALLAPSREAALSRVQAANYARGTGGLGVQTGTGRAPSNPLAQALFNAQAAEDERIRAEADQAAQQRIAFGTGLFGTGANLLGTQYQTLAQAYQPLLGALGVSGQVEQMAQMPYQLGVQLGQAAQPGASQAAQIYTGGQLQGAQTQYGATAAANAANAGFWSGLMQGGASIYGQSRRGTGSMWG